MTHSSRIATSKNREGLPCSSRQLLRIGRGLLLAAVIAAPTAVLAQESAERKAARETFQRVVDSLFYDRDGAKAQAGFLEVIEQDPTYPQPYFNLAVLAESEEKWNEAIEWFEKYRKLDQSSAFALKAEEELARLKIVRALDLTPAGRQQRRYDDLIARARLFLDSQLPKQAVAEAARAAQVDDARWEAYAVAAHALSEQGLLQDAAKFLHKAIQYTPEDKKQSLQRALQLSIENAPAATEMTFDKTDAQRPRAIERAFVDVEPKDVQRAPQKVEGSTDVAEIRGGAPLKRYVKDASASSQASRMQTTGIIDERVTLTRVGGCATARSIMFAGQNAFLEGASVKGVRGALLFKGAEPILDATSNNGTDFIIGQSSILVRRGNKTRIFPHGASFGSGKILHAQAQLLVYYLKDSSRTQFFTRTTRRLRCYFVAGPDFVAARMDNYGNTVVAYKDRLAVINKRGEPSPLFMLDGETVRAMEVMLTDNSILLATQSGLLKIPFSRKVYTILLGDGLLESDGSRFYWCDMSNEAHYEIRGLEAPGLLESDKKYVHALLAQGQKMAALGSLEKALQKFSKVLEIMPHEPNAQRLTRALTDRLLGRRPL